MSDYGLNIVGSAGNIQIDSTYKNYIECAAGSAGLSAGTNDVDITDTTKAVIVAMRPGAAEFSCYYGFVKSGSIFTHAKFMGGADDVTIYWKEFVEGLVESLPAYGLIVYNSSGDVVFHSDDKPMNIVSVNTGSFAYGPGNYSDETVIDADNNYFILMPTLPIYEAIDFDPPIWLTYFYSRGLKYIDGTTIRVGDFQFGGYGQLEPPPGPWDGWIDAYTLIEVE